MLVSQLAQIQSIVDNCSVNKHDFIIIGDFNIDLDRADNHRTILREFLDENDLKVDDRLFKQECKSSFKGYQGESSIDHCISKRHNTSIIDCRLLESVENFNDHTPILINYSLDQDKEQNFFKDKILKDITKIDYQDKEVMKEYDERIDSLIIELRQNLRSLKREKNEDVAEQKATDIYKKLCHGLTSNAEKSQHKVYNAPKPNKRSRSRRKLNRWWDQKLKTLHAKKCVAYRKNKRSDFKCEEAKKEYKLYKKLFRERKEYNAKIKRSFIFRYVNDLLKLNKDDFWRKIKQLGRRSGSVNIDVEELKKKYENVFNESNCDKADLDDKQRKVDEFKNSHKDKKFDTKTDPVILEGLISELSNGKSIGL